jgi:hypothetical protein
MAAHLPQANGSFRDVDAQSCTQISVFCCLRNIRVIFRFALDRAPFIRDAAH